MKPPHTDQQFSSAAAELALRHGLVLTFSHIGATLLAIAAFWGAVPDALLMPWLGLALVSGVAHAGAVWWGRRAHGGRYLWFVSGVAALAIAWGVAGVALFVPNTLQQAMLAMLVFSVAVVALLVLAAFARLYAFYLVVAVVPLLGRIAFEADRVHLIMAICGAAMTLALGLLGYTLRGTLRSWFALRARNQLLVDDLRLQKEAAEQANIAKSKFLAAASHDLRQPLHALSLFSAALSERIRYPEVRRIVDRILASVAALESLFNALLDISKLDAGALEPQKGGVRLKQILNRLENDYRPQAQAKGITLNVDDARQLYVHSDPALLERMLRNLVANAVRYTERGRIDVLLQERADQIEITVRDTGIGIEATDLAQIFDEFVQLRNPERDRSKGLGLGLAIVQRLSELLDHPIDVRSESGVGSEFSVLVPRGETKPEVEGAPISHVAEQPLADLTVLVVDDDLVNREAMQTLLSGWGCTVLCADGLDSAQRQAGADISIDCVIADYRLREGHTGVEVIEALKRQRSQAFEVLVLTGDAGLAQHGRIGEQDYRLMHKPANPARLRAFLNHLRRRRSSSAV